MWALYLSNRKQKVLYTGDIKEEEWAFAVGGSGALMNYIFELHHGNCRIYCFLEFDPY